MKQATGTTYILKQLNNGVHSSRMLGGLGWLMLTTFNQVSCNILQHNKLCK